MELKKGRTIKLFLIDGTPTGLKAAEIHNWTGHLLHFPRVRIADALERAEATRTGVYFLTGPDPENPARSRVYIGEGDNVAKRLKAHASGTGKDFWQFACIISSKDANLTKSHVRYLEARLIDTAKSANRASVENLTGPPSNPLPDSDIADMEYFLDQIEVLLPVVGLDFLRPKAQMAKAGADPDIEFLEQMPLELIRPKYQVKAHAIENDAEFVVSRGSTATVHEHSTNQYAGIRQQLIADGVLVSDAQDERLIFSEDTVFRSPSEAAAVILNRNANGRTEWKLRDNGQNLKEWQNARLQSD